MKVIFVTSQVITRHATMKRAAGMAGPLQALGWEVEVLAEDHPDNREYFGAVTGLTASFFPHQGMRGERELKNQFLREGRWDLIHVCGLGWRNAVSRRCGSALVVMDHVELESSLAGTPVLRRLAQAWLERWSRRYYTGAVGASRWLYNWLQAGGVSQVQHLPYGTEFVDDTGLAREAARFLEPQKLGRYALYCGGMYRNYGFWTMLDAFITLANAHPDFSAVLLGRGPEKEAGMNRVEAAGLKERIRFPGFVPEGELQLYLAGAAAHVSPLNDTVTDRARCPSKIPMYMMTGRPVVTCRVGEAWEYLGELGYYYMPGETSSLASVLGDLWRKDNRLVAYDLEKISWRAWAASYSEFWTSKVQLYKS